MRRALLLGFVGVVVLGAVAGKAADGCQVTNIAFDRGDAQAVLTFSLNVSACAPASELGNIDLQGSLTRQDPVFGRTSTSSEVSCDPETTCTMTLQLPHPIVDALSEYHASLDWKSTGPGPHFLLGGEDFYEDCQLAIPGAGVCLLA